MSTWLVLVLWGMVGCGSAVPDRDPVGESLAAPWGELALPVGDGQVGDISADSLHIAFKGTPSDQVPAVTARFVKALEREGWTVEEPRSVMGSALVDATRNGRSLSMMVSGMGKRVDVLLEAK